MIGFGLGPKVAHFLGRDGLAALLIASVAVNVWLSQELRTTRRRPATGVLSGTVVPQMSGVTISGAATTVHLDSDLPTVFYYFSADCGWCERNWANVAALVEQVSGRYRVVGVAASAELPRALTNQRMSFPILRSVDPDILAAYGFRGTPQTVVVGRDGRVLKSWTGAYQGVQAESVAKYFEVRLPGLSSKPR